MKFPVACGQTKVRIGGSSYRFFSRNLSLNLDKDSDGEISWEEFTGTYAAFYSLHCCEILQYHSVLRVLVFTF